MVNKLIIFAILLMSYQCYAQELLAPQIDAWKPMALDDLLKDKSTEVNLDNLEKTQYHSGLYVGVGYHLYLPETPSIEGKRLYGIGGDNWVVNLNYFFDDAFAFGVYFAMINTGSADTVLRGIEYTLKARSFTIGISSLLRANGDTFSPYALAGLGLTRHGMELKSEKSTFGSHNPDVPTITTNYIEIVPSAMLQVGLMIELGTDFFATWKLSFIAHHHNFDMVEGYNSGTLFGLELGYEF